MSNKLNLFAAVLRTMLITVLALVATIGFSDCLAGEQASTFNIYLSKEEPTQVNQDCGRVFAVTRTAPKTSAVAEAALNELFRGPTPEELRQGYRSWFSEEPRFILRSVRVSQGTAYVDLHDIRALLPGALTTYQFRKSQS